MTRSLSGTFSKYLITVTLKKLLSLCLPLLCHGAKGAQSFLDDFHYYYYFSTFFSHQKRKKKPKTQSHRYFLWTPVDEVTFQLKLRVPVCYCWRLCLSSWSLPFFLASPLLSLFPSLPSPFLESRSLLLPSISFFLLCFLSFVS